MKFISQPIENISEEGGEEQFLPLNNNKVLTNITTASFYPVRYTIHLNFLSFNQYYQNIFLIYDYI